MSAQKRFYRREDLIGKKVVGQDAKEVGSVKDTAFDAEGKLALIVSKKGSDVEEDYISISDIKAFGDYVLLKDVLTGGGASEVATGKETVAVGAGGVGNGRSVPPQPQTNKVCPKCHHVNSPNVGFCTRCGTKLT